jgi:hypothetical protein
LERFPKDGGIFPVKLFELRALGGSVVLNKADKAQKKKIPYSFMKYYETTLAVLTGRTALQVSPTHLEYHH